MSQPTKCVHAPSAPVQVDERGVLQCTMHLATALIPVTNPFMHLTVLSTDSLMAVPAGSGMRNREHRASA